MRRWLIEGGLLIAVTFALSASAATNKVKFAEITPLLDSGRTSAKAGTLRAAAAARPAPERPRFTQNAEGQLESLSAAPGTEFPVAGVVPGQPDTTAKNFLKQNGKVFGITSPSVDFKLRKKSSSNGRHSIRLTQTYESIPVFGGEMVVQVNDAGGVEHTSGNFDRDTGDLDARQLSTKPRLTAANAQAVAQSRYATLAAGQALSVTPPELSLFIPRLLKMPGPKRLTWKMDVWSADHALLGKRVFVDAHSGEFVHAIALIHEALNRRISDANNTSADPGTLVRSEGQAFSTIDDANAAYEYLGDTYDFYFAHFGRDGVRNTNEPLIGLVRYCSPTKPCPYKNAFWNGTKMVFGQGYAWDDVCAHELTHAVTDNESDLIYQNESGAINESLSDVFGEFVDLSNGRGYDDESVRWRIAEELADGYIRSMKNPTEKEDPDWRNSSYYQSPSGPPDDSNDQGGVHTNSGVNNKLCYLLTDGDTFRDITVTGMGINSVAALYYEANVNLLTSSSGWDHLAICLRQAAINLGWSTADRANLERGLQAVGIGTPLPQYFVDENASVVCFPTGDSYCTFLFDNGPYNNLSTALTDHAGAKTLLLRGTAKQTRLSGQARIVPWDGDARIQIP